MLTVPEDPARLARGNHSLEEDLRVIRRNGLTSDITQAESDFETFYHAMYVPFIRNRHGTYAVIRSIHWLRRAFHHGGLLWIRRNGQPVAGLLFQWRDQVLKCVVQGTINGEWAPVKAGAIAALYYYTLEYARDCGSQSIDFGGSRPSLNDGALRYKRKWGAHLIEQHTAHYDFLVYWNRLSGPVTAFLAHTPLIFRDRDGLSAVAVIGRSELSMQAMRADAWKAYRSLWVPGLRRLYLMATSGWQAGQESPPQTVLVDPVGARDCDAQTLHTLWSLEHVQ